MNRDREYVRAFAQRMTALGFTVYIAERGTHGFLTDAKESRVLCFGSSGDLSGAYGPPSLFSGTGWRMDAAMWDLKTADDVRAALYEYPPAFCGRQGSERCWSHFTTVAQFLKMYNASSRYARFSPES